MYAYCVPWPVSVNAAYRAVNNRVILSEAGRLYKERTVSILRNQHIYDCLTVPICVRVLCYPPDARRRDVLNLDKLVSDCFTTANIWQDDSLIKDHNYVEMYKSKENPRLTVLIWNRDRVSFLGQHEVYGLDSDTGAIYIKDVLSGVRLRDADNHPLYATLKAEYDKARYERNHV